MSLAYPQKAWIGTILSRVLFQLNPEKLGFLCPGCNEVHYVAIPPNLNAWTWNGDLERPTFAPSVLTANHHHGGTGRCHSFVTDGQIQFLSDCEHALAGQTVPLGDIETFINDRADQGGA